MFRTFLNHFGVLTIVFGAISVAAFWFGLQLCWAIAGKRWPGMAWRGVCALTLFGVGVVMIFLAAFGVS